MTRGRKRQGIGVDADDRDRLEKKRAPTANPAPAPAEPPAEPKEEARKLPRTGEHPIVAEKPPSFFWTHDLLVVAAAAVLLVISWIAYGRITKPAMRTFDAHGLRFEFPKRWLPGGDDPAAMPAHIWYQSFEEPLTRLEVKIAPRPQLSGPLAPVVDLSRANAYGDLYKRLDRRSVTLGRKEWIRTEFSYAFKPSKDDAPALSWGIEYALVNGEVLYVVTAHGSEARVADMEHDILATLKVTP